MRITLLALAISGFAVIATTALTISSSEAVAQTKPLTDGSGGCERDKPTPTTS